jgi:uncharacterized membrane protein HdeD (DUF308 family)
VTRTEAIAPPEGRSFAGRGERPPEPTATARRPPKLWAAIIWLALLGAAASVIGGHDTVVGTEITARLWGTFVLCGGCVLLAGAWGLYRRHDEFGRALGMVAALLGAALGAITFLVQVVNDEPDERLVIWTLITGLSFAAAWIVHGVTPEDERGQGLWNRLPILKSVVAAGLLFSLAQFWYTSIYVPTTAPASLTLEAALAERRVGDRVALEGSVTVKNTSGTRVSVIASVLNISAAAVVATGDPSDLDLERAVGVAHKEGDGVASLAPESAGRRFARPNGIMTVQRGPLLEESSFFEPGETVSVPFVVWIPAASFNVAMASVELVMARSNALASEDANPQSRDTLKRTVWTREIPEAGWLRQLTRNDRFLRVEYAEDPMVGPRPKVTFATAARGNADRPFDRRMWRFYGVNAARTSAVITLER